MELSLKLKWGGRGGGAFEVTLQTMRVHKVMLNKAYGEEWKNGIVKQVLTAIKPSKLFKN